MVYESDFYTTRRPYRPSPSLSTYTVSKREIPWEKVPFVPRPSLVPDPVTAFGKRKPENTKKVEKLIISPLERAKIRPAILEDISSKPYMTARDETREKVFLAMQRRDLVPKNLPSSDAMDVVLPRLHKVAECPHLPYKRRIVLASDLY